MSKVLIAAGAILGAAVWFLIFVILGSGLGTAFIAGGGTFAPAVLAAGMVSASARAILDAQVTTAGLVLGIATFVIMAVVLSISLWIDVVAGLGVMGVYNIGAALGRSRATGEESGSYAQPEPGATRQAATSVRNGHRRTEEPLGAR